MNNFTTCPVGKLGQILQYSTSRLTVGTCFEVLGLPLRSLLCLAVVWRLDWLPHRLGKNRDNVPFSFSPPGRGSFSVSDAWERHQQLGLESCSG